MEFGFEITDCTGKIRAVVKKGDISAFFAYDDTNGIGNLGQAHGGSVAQAVFLGQVRVFTNRKDHSGSLDVVLAQDDGPVMQWSVFLEDGFNHPGADSAVDEFAGIRIITQGHGTGKDNNGARSGVQHIGNSLNNGVGIKDFFILAHPEQSLDKSVVIREIGRAEVQKEFPDLLLKNDDQHDQAKPYETSEDL